MNPADDDGAFSIADFCNRYAISRAALYEDIAAGKLVARKRGKRTLIPRSEAREWLKSLPALVPAS